MRQLVNILPACGANLGGLVHIRVYPAANVVAIPDPVEGIIVDPIVLKDQYNYCDIFFPVGAASLDESDGEDEHGQFMKPKVVAYIPKDTPEFYDASIALASMKVVCLCQDNNGMAKLVGTPDFPLQFRFGTGTGKKYSDKNGMDFEFSGATPARAPFMLSLNIDAPTRRKVFSAGFTFGYLRTQ